METTTPAAEGRRFMVNGPLVVADTVDGEAILVHLGTGTYYSIVGDSVSIWNAVHDGASVEEIAAAVASRTGASPSEALSVVERFCDSLADEGLIVPREQPPAPIPEVDLAAADGGLLEPRFEAYSDMQDLVLLDPVHEVDERGWPHTQPAV